MGKTLLAILALSLLTACSKPQPTEKVKAALSKQIPHCLVAITTTPEEIGQTNLFGELANLAATLEDAKDLKRSWELNGDESVTLILDTKETKFDCLYSKSGSKWELQSVHRNDEKVYDRVEDQAIRAKHKLEKERKEQVEQEAYVKNWHEKSFSNVDYKYYEKNDDNAKKSFLGSSRPTLNIICEPDGPVFQYDKPYLSTANKTMIRFDGEGWDHQLTSSGKIGSPSDSKFTSYVFFNPEGNKSIIKEIKDAQQVSIEDYTYTMHDLSQVPCMAK